MRAKLVRGVIPLKSDAGLGGDWRRHTKAPVGTTFRPGLLLTSASSAQSRVVRGLVLQLDQRHAADQCIDLFSRQRRDQMPDALGNVPSYLVESNATRPLGSPFLHRPRSTRWNESVSGKQRAADRLGVPTSVGTRRRHLACPDQQAGGPAAPGSVRPGEEEPHMDREVTTTTRAAVAVNDVAADAVGFGTRPSRERPHSMRLDGGSTAQVAGAVSRGLDVLLGVGIGAAAMYYLDPASGSRRRARSRDAIGAAVGALGSALR